MSVNLPFSETIFPDAVYIRIPILSTIRFMVLTTNTASFSGYTVATSNGISIMVVTTSCLGQFGRPTGQFALRSYSIIHI